MNIKLVEKLYNDLSKLNNGTTLHKMDLHIHTPISKCYVKSCENEDEEYIKILDKILENDIRIVAITDHNTFDGYFKICEIINNDIKLKIKYKDILILPGIEISNFGKHYLAIFENEKNYDKQKELLGVFLQQIGIEMDERGNSNSDAINVTPIQLLKKIYENKGISILAHVDAKNGLLEKLIHVKKSSDGDQEWLQSGKSVAKIVTSSYLTAISLHNKKYKEKLEKEILNSKPYIRKNKIGIVFCSDSHSINKDIGASGGQIGEEYSYIKLSKVSFDGVKLALLDPEVRIYDEEKEKEYPYIEGVAIKGGFIKGKDEFALIRLHKQLNCIIGARGTGKSTILNIIQSNLWNEEEYINCEYDEAIVYLKNSKDCYAIYVKPSVIYDAYTNKRKIDTSKKVIYHKIGLSKFKRENISEKGIKKVIVNSFTSYKQKDIYKYASQEDGIKIILNNLLKLEGKDLVYQEKSIKNSFNQYFQDETNTSEDRFILKEFLSSKAKYSDEYIDEIINPYKKYIDEQVLINYEYKKIADKINESIGKHVRIEIKYTLFSQKDINKIIDKQKIDKNEKYENSVYIRKMLNRVMSFSNKKQNWYFWIYIFKKDKNELMDKYCMKEEEAIKIINFCRPCLNNKYLYVVPRSVIDFSYNVNSGISNKMVFRIREQLSLGQRAVAMLLVIIKAANDIGDNRPLIIDQPEDDLDNVYIYSSLVRHFREVKNNRQLIVATHNANIPIAGDAENILIMDSNGEQGFMRLNGSIDKQDICKNVLEILEGGSSALKLRLGKYNKLLDDKVF
ncbi:hypothetical protein J1C67_06665 [Clostridium gasigenes]|uniref:Spaf_1101 family AAA-like ATPase n=1 Tax=Clostridium gasigenes TaxID=94869 RepID=UPI0014384485|nr:hypothetical protein [Clostridium gasigenes]NKF08311.1 hypothetical protein [Clostridium gasigenes]QSW20814.1 hypothetical protein J1C67_06665 [Clostridium gasigenes]